MADWESPSLQRRGGCQSGIPHPQSIADYDKMENVPSVVSCWMSSGNFSFDNTFQRLRDLRLALLRLHKALLHSERIIYEQFYGRIQSNAEFFQLVISHDWFDWLRPISQFIIQIDDVLNAKEPVPMSEAQALMEQARTLLQPKAEGNSLETRYYRAIQRDPDIALMHAEVTKLLFP